MGGVPLASFDHTPIEGVSVRQLRLLDGGVGLGPAVSTQLAGDRSVLVDATRSGIVLVALSQLSLAAHLFSLAVARTCFCCGAAMAEVGAGAALRCEACGAETEAIAAA